MSLKKKTILIICAGLPYPPNDGVRTRVYNVARQLQKYFDIRIVSIIKGSDDELKQLDEAQKHLSNNIVPVYVRRSLLRKIVTLVSTILSGSPFEKQFYYFREVEDAIRKLTVNMSFDYVQFERSFLCFYRDVIPQVSITTLNLYDFETLRHERLEKMYKGIGRWLAVANQKRIRKYEKSVFNNVNKIFAISETEKRDIERECGISSEKIGIVTGGIDTANYPYIESLPNENSIMFVGSGMNFNYDAIRYFYYDILPLIKKRIDNVKWYIIGKLDPSELSYLNDDPAVVFIPNVPSVIPYYQKTKLLVVPLRGGSGTRIKIFESMALGRSIVSTSIGCEGIDVTNGENILVEDSSLGISNAVCALLNDHDKNNMLRSNAYSFIKEKYDWVEVCKPLIDYYRDAEV